MIDILINPYLCNNKLVHSWNNKQNPDCSRATYLFNQHPPALPLGFPNPCSHDGQEPHGQTTADLPVQMNQVAAKGSALQVDLRIAMAYGHDQCL